MDPKVATETAERVQAMAQRDLYSALFVTALVFLGIFALWIAYLTRQLAKANEVTRSVMEARVSDQKENLRESSAHLDKNTEALTLVLAMTRARAQQRRRDDTSPGEKTG